MPEIASIQKEKAGAAANFHKEAGSFSAELVTIIFSLPIEKHITIC